MCCHVSDAQVCRRADGRFTQTGASSVFTNMFLRIYTLIAYVYVIHITSSTLYYICIYVSVMQTYVFSQTGPKSANVDYQGIAGGGGLPFYISRGSCSSPQKLNYLIFAVLFKTFLSFSRSLLVFV